MNELGPLVEVFAEFSPWPEASTKDDVSNFLGAKIDREFLELIRPSNALQAAQGETLGETPEGRVPVAADGEAFFEFASIHKAVTAARERFVLVELGGGYAARSVDAHRLLQKLNPMPSQLVVVEAEPTHFEWAKRHLINNGIDPQDHWLINAAVGADSDPKLFMLGSGVYYNGIVDADTVEDRIRDIINMNGTEQVLRNLLTAGRCGMHIPYNSAIGEDIFDYKFVSSIPLADILAPLSHVDLIDMDIQGAEDTVIPPAMEMLDRRVKRVHIGTHRADYHSGLWDLFFEHEWVCEFDYAPFGQHSTAWGDFETTDGILHFQNPRL